MLVTKIKEYRELAGYKQSELAELVGARRETIVHLENGKYNPCVRFLPYLNFCQIRCISFACCIQSKCRMVMSLYFCVNFLSVPCSIDKETAAMHHIKEDKRK